MPKSSGGGGQLAVGADEKFGLMVYWVLCCCPIERAQGLSSAVAISNFVPVANQCQLFSKQAQPLLLLYLRQCADITGWPSQCMSTGFIPAVQ